MESNKVGQEKPKLILLTGPQGSGNHMWSKLFAMHPVVTGWVMQNYWEGHHEEPFAQYWENPDKLKEFEIPENKKYFVTSISCPYFKDGKIDIWKSNADIIGSIAFYLARNKWQRNQPIAVKAHGFSEKNMNSQYKVQDLRRSGIKLPLDWDNELKANLIELEGEFGKEYWVVLQNFKSILSYNPRNKYAMAVFQLAEKLKEAVKK